jgi:hypothetical protein
MTGTDSQTMNTIPRIGSFFILIGLGLLTLFVISVWGNETNGMYLLFSLPALFLGFIFRRKAPPTESGRFGSIRRASEYNRRRREERMNRKQKK